MTIPVTPIVGYTEQTPETIAQVNANKRMEEEILRMLDQMTEDVVRYDQRWTALARTHIEIGFGAMNRAILKPKRLTDDQYAALTNVAD